MFDTTIGSRFPNPRVVKQFGNHTMPETGDNVAKDFGVSRASRPTSSPSPRSRSTPPPEKEGFYSGEILAITLPSEEEGCAGREHFAADEHPRRDATMESLAKLKPLFEGGVVTAGNASGVNDGAAALIDQLARLGSKHNGKKPMAKILAAAQRRRRAAHHGRRARPTPFRSALERAKLQLRTWTSSRSTKRSPARCSAACS